MRLTIKQLEESYRLRAEKRRQTMLKKYGGEEGLRKAMSDFSYSRKVKRGGRPKAETIK